jgi:hypothetical protein
MILIAVLLGSVVLGTALGVAGVVFVGLSRSEDHIYPL